MELHIIKLNKEDPFYKNEITYLFGDMDMRYMVITIQPSGQKLFGFKKTEESETFKDECLENFMEYCQKIEPNFEIFDYVDPAQGTLMNLNNTSKMYSEVQGGQKWLVGPPFNYSLKKIGSCMLLEHPKYGIDVYPASFFIGGNKNTASEEELNELLQKYK